MANCVPACLFVCLALTCIYAQVGSLCRPNERLLACGCPKTCRDPVPNCEGVCKMGCFCEKGEVRNDTGHCVKLADCPPVSSNIKQDTSEPRLHDECPDNEEYRFCEPCLRTCANPNPMCPAQCSRGCFCKGNLLRDKDGSCVPFHECSNFLDYIRKREENHVDPTYRFTCGHNRVYKNCEKCTRTCSDAHPVCGTKCKGGCFCKDGLVEGPDGKCLRIEECPRAATFSIHSPTSVEVEDCTSSEEYFSCGWCEPTCQEPHPSCPDGCTSGCLCCPPLLRHASGKCVMEDQCDIKKCSTNEEYACRSGCESTCAGAGVKCESRPRRCTLGCYCKLGYLRDEHGRCVTYETCLAYNVTLSTQGSGDVTTQRSVEDQVYEAYN